MKGVNCMIVNNDTFCKNTFYFATPEKCSLTREFYIDVTQINEIRTAAMSNKHRSVN
jgi:hypothetical protein